MNVLWAIAHNTLREALRSRLFLTLAIAGLVLIGLGQFMQTEGQSAQGSIQLMIAWVFGVTHIFAIFLTLIIAAFTLPRDREERRLQTVVTKPVPPAMLFLGKWIGTAMVGAISVGVLGAMGLLMVYWTARDVSETDPGLAAWPILHAEAITFNETRPTSATDDGEWKISIPVGEQKHASWEFSEEAIRRCGDVLRIRMLGSVYVDAVQSAMVHANYIDVRVQIRSTHAEEHEKGISQDFTIQNRSAQYLTFDRSALGDIDHGAVILVKPLTEGLKLGLEPESVYLLGESEWFAVNWFIACFLLACQIAVLAALAIFASGFMGGPVSFFAGLAMYSIALFHSFFMESLSHAYVAIRTMTDAHGHVHRSPNDIPLEIVKPAAWISERVLSLIPDLSRFDFAQRLMENRSLTPGSFQAGWGVLILTGITLAVAGWVVLRRKEMAQ